jgi:erythromycin esterase
MVMLAAGCGRSAATPDEAASRSVARHAAPLSPGDESLSPAAARLLDDAVAGARLVGVGESRHDTHEQMVIKQQLVRRLVTAHGFRLLILEESYAHAQALDRYVTTGEGDPAAILNALPGWYLWDVEEISSLVRWIRHRNAAASPDDMIRIAGMDITAPAPGMRLVLDYLHERGLLTGTDATDLRLDLHDGEFWPAVWSAHGALSPAERDTLGRRYETLAAAFDDIPTDGDDQAAAMSLHARIGVAAQRLYCSADRAAGGVAREQGQFAVVRHLLDHEFPAARAVIWTHNLHAARGTFRMPDFGDDVHTPVGVMLGDLFGDAYLAIGATFGTGRYPGDAPPGARDFPLPDAAAMDGMMARATGGALLVDLREAGRDPAATDWLSRERAWRAQDANAYQVPADAFDLVFHVPTVSRARLTTAARARHGVSGR